MCRSGSGVRFTDAPHAPGRRRRCRAAALAGERGVGLARGPPVLRATLHRAGRRHHARWVPSSSKRTASGTPGPSGGERVRFDRLHTRSTGPHRSNGALLPMLQYISSEPPEESTAHVELGCAHLDLATVAMNRHTLWWARRCSTGHLLRDLPCAVERYRGRSQCRASSYTAFIATTDSVARPISGWCSALPFRGGTLRESVRSLRRNDLGGWRMARLAMPLPCTAWRQRSHRGGGQARRGRVSTGIGIARSLPGPGWLLSAGLLRASLSAA
jgi:hypothetical protein